MAGATLGEVGGGGGGGRCKGREDDVGKGGEEGETGEEGGKAALGTERVVEREALGVEEGVWGEGGWGGEGMGGRGWGVKVVGALGKRPLRAE